MSKVPWVAVLAVPTEVARFSADSKRLWIVDGVARMLIPVPAPE